MADRAFAPYPCQTPSNARHAKTATFQRWLFLLWIGTALALSGCGYNEFQRGNEQVKASWSEVLSQYQRRTDLIPNLINVVKGQADFEQSTYEVCEGSQLAALLVPTTQPETIEQYALRVAEQWKLGRTKVDDGAILVVTKNDRAVRMEVGYGLEGTLNDATSKRIIEESITPAFGIKNFLAASTPGSITLLTTWVGLAGLLRARYEGRGDPGGGFKGGGGGFGGSGASGRW